MGSVLDRYLTEEFGPGRSVIALFDEASQTYLRTWCEGRGFDLTWNYQGERIRAEDFDFHVTIAFYDVGFEGQPEVGGFPLDPPVRVWPRGCSVLGIDRAIPVLNVEVRTKRLPDMRRQWKRDGMKERFSFWVPHVSLSYAPASRELYEVLTSSQTLPKTSLYLDRIQIEEVTSI